MTAEIGGERQDTGAAHRCALGRSPSAMAGPQEFAILRAAHGAGVSVPEPLWLCRDPAVLGRDFYLMRRIAGVAQGHRVVKDKSLGGDRAKLAERLGAELARIHSIRPGERGLEFLPLPQGSPALDAIAGLRTHLDRRERGHPVLEWGSAPPGAGDPPPRGEIVLTHQDFRTGNYMVDGAGLTGDPRLGVRRLGRSHDRYRLVLRPLLAFRRRRRWRRAASRRGPISIAATKQASGRRIDRAGRAFLGGHGPSALGRHRPAAGRSPYRRRRALPGAGADRPARAGARADDHRAIWRPVPGPPRHRCLPPSPNEPDGEMLLAEARRVMLEDLLPLLPAAGTTRPA